MVQSRFYDFLRLFKYQNIFLYREQLRRQCRVKSFFIEVLYSLSSIPLSHLLLFTYLTVKIVLTLLFQGLSFGSCGRRPWFGGFD
jgi:hypothetical protein